LLQFFEIVQIPFTLLFLPANKILQGFKGQLRCSGKIKKKGSGVDLAEDKSHDGRAEDQ